MSQVKTRAAELARTVEIDGLEAAYYDDGSGPPVVMVHCSSGTHRAWSFARDALRERHRMLAPDLFGYGASAPWPEHLRGRPATPDLHLVEELVRMAGEPVHLVGHSYGGAMSLEVARRSALRGDGRVRSLFLVEPVSFHILRTEGRDREWREVARVARRCIDASDRGDRAAASRPYMAYWIGMLGWWLMSRRLRAGILDTIHKVADEFRTMFELDHRLAEYRAVDCPTTVIAGSRTRRPASLVAELVAGAIDGARLLEIPGAGHMSPFTHRPWLRAALEEHVAAS